jgi:hypothetical protein
VSRKGKRDFGCERKEEKPQIMGIDICEKTPKKTNTRKMSQKGAAKQEATKTESKKSAVQPLGMNQIREKPRELGLTVPVGISKTELIRSI